MSIKHKNYFYNKKSRNLILGFAITLSFFASSTICIAQEQILPQTKQSGEIEFHKWPIDVFGKDNRPLATYTILNVSKGNEHFLKQKLETIISEALRQKIMTMVAIELDDRQKSYILINAHLIPSAGKTLVSFSSLSKTKDPSERNMDIKDLIIQASTHIEVDDDEMVKHLWESRHLLKANATSEDYILSHCEAIGIKLATCRQEILKLKSKRLSNT